MNSYFFLTGMSRSGTTVLDKLLSMHPSCVCFSQPLPYLYRYYKTMFFKDIKYKETRYILNNLFKEREYTANDLDNFLKSHKINISSFKNLLEESKDFSGTYTEIKDIDSVVTKYKASNFFETYKFYLTWLNKQNKNIIGGKETNCEEFIEPFLNNGIKCILIYRDPRDIISSLNTGRGKEYGGITRPLLFHIRNWRKSIDIGLSLRDNKNLLLVSYEDFVSNTVKIMNEITVFLELETFYNKENLSQDILDQNGKVWKSNSSNVYSDVNNKTINKNNFNKYKLHLNDNTIKFIEKTCYHEMKYLGYEFENKLNELKEYNLKNYEEQFDIEIDDIRIDYSTCDENIEDENYRFNAPFSKNISNSNLKDLFISERAYQKLVNENYRTES